MPKARERGTVEVTAKAVEWLKNNDGRYESPSGREIIVLDTESENMVKLYTLHGFDGNIQETVSRLLEEGNVRGFESQKDEEQHSFDNSEDIKDKLDQAHHSL